MPGSQIRQAIGEVTVGKAKGKALVNAINVTTEQKQVNKAKAPKPSAKKK